MKTGLYNKVLTYDFKKLFARKGYAFFTKGAYNLNIIGVRASGKKVTNTFNDYLVLIYNTNQDDNLRKVFTITTDPGRTMMINPINPQGTAILVPGQYRAGWKLGYHKNYQALVQNKTVKVYRDRNKDEIYDLDPKTIQQGQFGINIHKAGNFSKFIDNWSAGCQVFQSSNEFSRFMGYVKKQIAAGLGDKFTYTLVNEEDLV